MASNTTVFQQVKNRNGDVEFRTKFGRSKSFVYRKHDKYFYVDLYDNRPNRNDNSKFQGICLGMDEIDYLISLRPTLDSLQTCFPPVENIPSRNPVSDIAHVGTTPGSFCLQQHPPTPPAGTYQAVPIQVEPNRIIQHSQLYRPRDSGSNLDHPGSRRYENITPPADDHISQEIVNEFFLPM